MDQQESKTVIVLENTAVKAAREIVNGVMRYAAAHPSWHISVCTGHPAQREETVCRRRPDGIISGFTDEPSNPIPRTYRVSTPAVFTCAAPFKNMRAPFLEMKTNDADIGRLAAKTLLQAHVRAFGFLGSRHPSRWSDERLFHFRKTLAEANAGRVSVLSPAARSATLESERTALARWIRRMEKPCGIFAANDARGSLVLEVCREGGIDVPGLVKVVGVDNDEILCECAHPTLSSIEPDFESGGYAAAAALDGLMGGRKRTGRHLSIAIKGVVRRQSTSDASGSGHRASRAMEMIRRQASGHLSVLKIAQAVGCSVRLLEKDFRKTRGHTLVEEINLRRLARVRELLRNTSMDESSIAGACGFGSLGYLRNLFKAHTGTTMRAWRASLSDASPAARHSRSAHS